MFGYTVLPTFLVKKSSKRSSAFGLYCLLYVGLQTASKLAYKPTMIVFTGPEGPGDSKIHTGQGIGPGIVKTLATLGFYKLTPHTFTSGL